MKLKLKTSAADHSEDAEYVHEPTDWRQFLDDLFSPLGRYEHLRITPNTTVPVPVPVIKIRDEIISTAGNITTVSGASKSGKSALMSLFLAGAISRTGAIIDPLQDLYVEPNFENKAVIHIDTEQSRYDHKKKQKTILERACFKHCPRYFLSYNIRQLDLPAYVTFIQGVCLEANQHLGGIHLIALDGGADFIRNVNDPDQSSEIIKLFGDLALKYNVPVIIIVHTNPGSDKERGHFGSECQRKSESILRVCKNGEVSHIEPVFLRNAGNGSIPRVQFTYDKEKGYHVSCGYRSPDAADNGSQRDAQRLGMLKKLAQEAFEPPTALQDKDCQSRLMAASGKQIATVKNYLAEMRAHEFIVKDEDGLWRLNSKHTS